MDLWILTISTPTWKLMRVWNKSYKEDDIYNQDIEPQANGQLAVGVGVKHAKFGYGTVLNFEGDGDSARIQIKFKSAGTKWLIASYANLEFV